MISFCFIFCEINVFESIDFPHASVITFRWLSLYLWPL